jgi:putative DNA primase/helicase
VRAAEAPRGEVTLRPENVPTELKARRQWVVWRHEERDSKATKIPYRPANPEARASATDLMTWGTFREAQTACERGEADGIGFVFSSGDPYAGVDLDGCRDPKTGEIERWAAKTVDRLDGYAEVSPSGTGVHVIVRGKAPNRRRGPLEMYSSERFFTVTGEVL